MTPNKNQIKGEITHEYILGRIDKKEMDRRLHHLNTYFNA